MYGVMRVPATEAEWRKLEDELSKTGWPNYGDTNGNAQGSWEIPLTKMNPDILYAMVEFHRAIEDLRHVVENIDIALREMGKEIHANNKK